MRWEWLKHRLKELGSNSSQFAVYLNWEKSRVYELFSGKTKAIPQQYLTKAAQYLHVRLEDLIAFNNGETSEIPQPKPIYKSQEAVIKENNVRIDILDVTACCGTGLENLNENIVGQWLIPSVDFKEITLVSPQYIKMLRVKGDSMEPTLKDGDWVLVDISRTTPDSDGMFLLRLANGLAVKRIQCGFGNEIAILSDNKLYQPFNSTIDDATIVGKVIYTLKAEKVG